MAAVACPYRVIVRENLATYAVGVTLDFEDRTVPF